VAPWYEIAVDSVGPWDFRDAHGDAIEFMALTIIDTVTNLCEIVPMRNKTAKHIGLSLENTWVARYPKPVKCIYDQGNEFLGAAFQAKLEELDVTPSAAGTKNPQANSIVERLHQSVANSLRTLSYAHPPETQADKEDLINTALQTASCANKATMHSTMKVSPGAAAFSRNMIINVPMLADFRLLKARREAVINYNLLRENKKRISHDYQVGESVLKLVFRPNKLQPNVEGPYPIAQVHANGSLTMQLTADVTERINLRRVKPHQT